MRPAWKIELDGRDMSERIRSRFISVQTVDGRGRRADRVTLTLQDEPPVDWPPSGRRLRVLLGWGTELTEVGEYAITRPVSSGPPAVLEVTGHAVSAGSASGSSSGGATGTNIYQVGVGTTQVWSNTTLGAITREVARALGLTPSISSELASKPVASAEMRENQGYLYVLQQLAHERGGDMRPYPGRLVVAAHLSGASAGTGQTMPKIKVAVGTVIRWSGAVAERDQIQVVRARYQDPATGTRGTASHGSGDRVRMLPRVYTSEAEALDAAEAAMTRRQGKARELELTLRGDPRIVFGATLDTTEALRADMGGEWRVLEVSHRLDAKGFTTTVKTRAVR